MLHAKLQRMFLMHRFKQSTYGANIRIANCMVISTIFEVSTTCLLNDNKDISAFYLTAVCVRARVCVHSFVASSNEARIQTGSNTFILVEM